jgi:hypothetical protein
MSSIIVFAESCEKYESTRVRACEDTWAPLLRARGIDVLFVIGCPDQPDEFQLVGNILYVKCRDEYRDLPAKTRMAAKYFTEYCPCHDYMFKCDDDTYIHARNFAKFDIKGAAHLGARCGTYPSGGAGYFLNRQAASIVAQSKLSTGPEDKEVGQLLRDNSITPVFDRRFSGWPSSDWKQSPAIQGTGWHGDIPPPYEKLKDQITDHLLRAPASVMYDIHNVVEQGLTC